MRSYVKVSLSALLAASLGVSGMALASEKELGHRLMIESASIGGSASSGGSAH